MGTNKKALIFGISGFVGHYLADELNDNGYEVFGCDVVRSDFVQDNAAFYECDILNADEVNEIVRRVAPQYIFNLAAVSSVGQSWQMPQKTVEINVVGALNILEAIKNNDPSVKVLLIGSSEEYSQSDNSLSESSPLDGSNPYGISKIMQEKYADLYRKKYGMRVYYVRSFNHIGPRQSERFVIPSWCKQVAEISDGLKEPEMTIGNVYLIRDFTDVRDVARAYRMVIEYDNCDQVYNVGNGKAVKLKEILDHLIDLSGQNIKLVVDEKLIRKNESSIIRCDNSLISNTIGWTVEHEIFDTIDEVYWMYKKR